MIKIKKIFPILIIAFILTNCVPNKQSTPYRSNKGFFTPPKWQEPIKKGGEVSTPKAFKPDFKSSDKTPAPGNQGNEKGVQSLSNIPPEQMTGYASWYGPGFHGKATANGEKYNQNQMTAAHKILPMNTWVQVTNLENNKHAVVRINDRGPYKKNRIIDLTRRAAEKLGFKDQGTARVSLKILQYPKNFDASKGLTPYKQVVIQIAVFKDKKRAYNYKSKLSRKYLEIPFFIDEKKQNKYYVVAGPYDKRNQAKGISQSLKADGIDNFVKSYRK